MGSIVPSTETDVSQHIALALAGFGRLRNGIFSNRSISTRLKARLYGALILPIAIYGAEAWMLRSQERQSFEGFEMCCLWAIRGVTTMDRQQNFKIREDTFTPESITDVNRHTILRWFGHVCHMQRDNIVRQAYKQDFKEQQKRGRPLKRWCDQIRNDTGFPLLTAEQHTINRTEWRGATSWRPGKGHYCEIKSFCYLFLFLLVPLDCTI